MQIKTGIYKHFKGKHYKVLGIAINSQNLEKMVLYQALYDSKEFGNNALWVRPVSDFLGKIEQNGQKFFRFTLIEPNSNSEFDK